MKNLLRILASVLVVVFAAASFAACANNNASVTTNDTKEVTTDDIIDDTGMAIGGGWQAGELAADNVSAEQKAVFEKALSGEGLGVGVDYTPKDVLAKQTVAGWKYAFLCVKKIVVPNATPSWCVITVYEGTDGSTAVERVTDIDIADIKTKENSSAGENPSGGWDADVNETKLSISAKVDGAIDNYVGLSLTPTAVLGTQVVAGTNYKILAYGAPVVPNASYDLYVVTVFDEAAGDAQVTSVEVFDLISYLS